MVQTPLISLLLPLKNLLDRVPLFPRNILALEEHLLLNSGHGFGVRITGVVLEAGFVAETMLQAGVLDEVLEVPSIFVGDLGLLHDNFF